MRRVGGDVLSVEPDAAAVIRRLSTLDRFLPLWIALPMAGGLALGSLIPGLNSFLDTLKVGRSASRSPWVCC